MRPDVSEVFPQFKEKTMRLSNTNYDLARKIINYWLPALGTLYFTLSSIWAELPFSSEVVATLTAFVVFTNVVLGVSKHKYENNPENFDGDIVVDDSYPEKNYARLELNEPVPKLQKKKIITMRVRNEGGSQ